VELLASRPLGRISYGTHSGPVTLPVNHVVIEGDVYFRTAADSDLGRTLTTQPRVCYEVDDFDEFFRFGWSVLVRGRATVVGPDYPLSGDLPAPWAAGERSELIRIHSEAVSGRRVMWS
jgi:nitroimidazol reductase NimA-like FMN-containing flavoprotein (pyridoxamine 5'-phosphate oxidase superfamily)